MPAGKGLMLQPVGLSMHCLVFSLQLLSLWGSTYNCLAISVPEIRFVLRVDVEQPRRKAIIIIIDLIYIAQFDTNSILTMLHIVIRTN